MVDSYGRAEGMDSILYDIINQDWKERWVNIYPCLLGHESKIEADIQADNDRIACVKISYKIGEGL